MTPFQRAAIESIRSAFNANCSTFTSIDNKRYCFFHLYENKSLYSDSDNRNIVAIYTIIKDIDNDGFPITQTVEVSVSESGKVTPLNELFADDQESIRYLRTLTKIEE